MELFEALAVQGDNNGLQTVVAALELVYTDPAWPSTAPALNTSLRCYLVTLCAVLLLLSDVAGRAG